jgi:sugar/nucleoside kinase (ribokinase family)
MMFNKNIDFLAVGDITTDAFIRLKQAEVHCKVNTNACEICLAFGDKVPFEYVKIVKAVGNSANAAVVAARLGLRSGLAASIGGDQNGEDCMAELRKNNVSTRFMQRHADKLTNYHFVLWYDVDRTILVNHVEYNYSLPKIPSTPRWMYLSSLASNSLDYHMELTEYLKKNPTVKLCFQPGTFQMKLGVQKLKEIYQRTEVFVVNVEEAQRILNNQTRDVKTLMAELHALGPKIVLITDGPAGAYMLDGEHFYFMPIYPDPKPPVERTGCGDSFAATFVSALIMGKSPLEALVWAPVNPMSVVQYIGAQEGLLTRDQVEWWLSRASAEYKPKEI